MPRFSLRRRAVLHLAAALTAMPVLRALGQEQPLDDTVGLEPENLVTPVSAAYQALSSYTDSGTIEYRYQWPDTPLLIEKSTFETAYRAPRNFFFRFDGDPASGGDAYVIWCDGGDFQSWWKATGVHTVHDNGQGAVAFLNGQSPSRDAANLVAPHLFPQALLVGPTYRLIDPVARPPESVDSHACHTITATSRVTGTQTVDHRPITLWIDDNLGLVRKVHVEPELDSPPGLIDELTYLLQPEANPELADDRFTFTPPQG